MFQFSRLLYTQWRSNPAVAIASVVVNAYKNLSVLIAKDADVAQTIVGVTYLRFMKNVQTNICALCSPQAHLRMADKNSL